MDRGPKQFQLLFFLSNKLCGLYLRVRLVMWFWKYGIRKYAVLIFT